MASGDSVGHVLMTAGHILTQVGTRLVSARNEELAAAVGDAQQLAQEAYELGRRHEREGTPPTVGDDHQDDGPAVVGEEHQGDNPATAAGQPPAPVSGYAPVLDIAARRLDHQGAAPVGTFTD